MKKFFRFTAAALCLAAIVYFLMPLGLGISHIGMYYPCAVLAIATFVLLFPRMVQKLLHSRLRKWLIAAASLLGAGMWSSIGHIGDDRWAVPEQIGQYLWFAGLAGFVITCVFASGSGHRGFSHSLLALTIETLCLWLIFPATALPFAIAFASHVLLDMLNKRSVRLFYPAKKGICLGWFYADKLANKVVAAGGMVWLIAAVIFCLRA